MNIKPIPDFNNYFITNTGLVFSDKSGVLKPLKGVLSKQGYPRVFLRRDGKYHYRYIHRLVAEVFIVDFSVVLEVNHIDGVKINNNLANLEMCTRAYNAKHAFLIGLNKTGENHGRSKLTNKQVSSIKSLITCGYDGVSIARMYGVSTALISLIKNSKVRVYDQLNIGCE